MKAIITRANEYGEFPQVGTTDRIVVSHYKTSIGVHKFARKYAGMRADGVTPRSYRIEFFHDKNFGEREPFAVQYSYKSEIKSR